MASGNDPLFIERLDVFMEKFSKEICEFALREQRSFEQVCITKIKVSRTTPTHLTDAAGH